LEEAVERPKEARNAVRAARLFQMEPKNFHLIFHTYRTPVDDRWATDVHDDSKCVVQGEEFESQAASMLQALSELVDRLHRLAD
jgi:hypothetical protein